MKCRIKAKSTSPMLMHKFIGMAESKQAKKKPLPDHAESFAYRDKDGNLAIPIMNMKACIIDGFVQSAGSKQKTSTKMNVSSRIGIKSLGNDPMNLTLDVNEYEINRISVPSGGRTGGVRDWCVRPMIPEWSVEFVLVSNVDISEEDLKYKMIFAGTDVGIMSNRPNGYGRFEIVEFEEIQ